MANIVKAYAERAGFDASTFSGHSLRASFLTSAAAKGASIFKMMDVSRHKSYAQNSGRPCMKGGPQREMPAWKEVFTDDQFESIYAFLLTVQSPADPAGDAGTRIGER